MTLPPDLAKWLGELIVVINLILRFKTKQPVTLSASEKVGDAPAPQFR